MGHARSWDTLSHLMTKLKRCVLPHLGQVQDSRHGLRVYPCIFVFETWLVSETLPHLAAFLVPRLCSQFLQPVSGVKLICSRDTCGWQLLLIYVLAQTML